MAKKFVMYEDGKYSTQSHAGASKLDDLDDVTVNEPSGSDILIYDDTDNTWKNDTIPKPKVSELSDTNISSLSDGQVLTYESSSSKWKNKAIPKPKVSELSDTNISSPSNNDGLIYNSSSNKWENKAIPKQKMSELTDTSIIGLADDDILIYDDNAHKWKNIPMPSTPVQDVKVNGTSVVNQNGEALVPAIPDDLNDFTDVDINSPTNNQGLIYNSTSGKWENHNIPGGGGGGASSLPDLSDVSVNAPTNNQVLTYETSTARWKNKDISSGNISYDNTTSELQATTIQGAIDEVQGNLNATVNNNTVPFRFVYDSTEGKYGYLDGADTFHPFNEGGGGGLVYIDIPSDFPQRIYQATTFFKMRADCMIDDGISMSDVVASANVTDISKEDDLIFGLTMNNASANSMTLKLLSSAFAHNHGDSEVVTMTVYELPTLHDTIGDESILNYILENTWVDDEDYQIPYTINGVTYWIDTNPYIGFSRGGSEISINNRDGKSYNIKANLLNLYGGMTALKIYYEGDAAYQSPDVIDQRWELYVIFKSDWDEVDYFLNYMLQSASYNTGTNRIRGCTFDKTQVLPYASFYYDPTSSSYTVRYEEYDESHHITITRLTKVGTMSSLLGVYNVNVDTDYWLVLKAFDRTCIATDSNVKYTIPSCMRVPWHSPSFNATFSYATYYGGGAILIDGSTAVQMQRQSTWNYMLCLAAYAEKVQLTDLNNHEATRLVWLGNTTNNYNDITVEWEVWLFDNDDIMIYINKVGSRLSGDNGASQYWGNNYNPTHDGTYICFIKTQGGGEVSSYSYDKFPGKYVLNTVPIKISTIDNLIGNYTGDEDYWHRYNDFYGDRSGSSYMECRLIKGLAVNWTDPYTQYYESLTYVQMLGCSLIYIDAATTFQFQQTNAQTIRYAYVERVQMTDISSHEATRCVWGGISDTNVGTVDKWWELWFIDTGDLMLYVKNVGSVTNGTCVIVNSVSSTLYTADQDNMFVSFYRKSDNTYEVQYEKYDLSHSYYTPT